MLVFCRKALAPALKIVLAGVLSVVCFAQVSVLTQHNDNARTGQNLSEIRLTPANVNANNFGILFNHPVDGAIVGQPLYVPNLQFSSGLHNVIYVATQNDTIYAFDAGSNQGANASPLWSVHYSNPVPADEEHFVCGNGGYTQIGIMGTPVIDPATNTIYFVAKTIEQGTYYFRLHALDLITGVEKFGGPSIITATVQTHEGPYSLTPAYYFQRPGLLLLNGNIYIGFGSNGCDEFDYRGWVLAYSSSTLQQTGVYLTTPDGAKGALWAAGGGIAADSAGFLYFSTGNGTFDVGMGGTDLGDSILKMSPVEQGFTVKDYFTPFDQARLQVSDLDLGSGGIMVLPDQGGTHPHELVGGGKAGTLYLADRDNMGQFNPATDLVVQEFVAITPSIKTTPAYWNGNVYLSGQKDYVKRFTISNGLMSSAPVDHSAFLNNDRGPSLSISANGINNGILWVMVHGTPILYAFDGNDLTHELYDTTQALQQRDSLTAIPKYVVPTVADGRVYVGGVKTLNVFGLLPALAVTGGNNQSGTVSTTLPVPLGLHAADSYTGTVRAGVSVSCKDNGASGKFSNPAGVTDANGDFSTTYTLPNKAQVVNITCKAKGFASAFFTETATLDAAKTMQKVSGNNQTAPVNTQLPAPLVVRVVDAHNNPVAGVSVTFSDGGIGGSFSNPTGTSDSSGLVQTNYTTPPTAGSYKLTVKSSGLKTIRFAVTVTAN